MVVAALGTATQITTGWKWIAVLVGVGVLALMWGLVAVSNREVGLRVWKLAEGADGKPSTSKFQWLIWLAVVLFAYSVLWVVRARTGNYGAITDVPANLLAVLGFSTVTATAAKGITIGYKQSGRIVKSDGGESSSGEGGILTDDTGFPELAKIQMMAFTFIAVGVFLITLLHQIHTNPAQTNLPNIDSSLLVLMGVSQGGYLGKKLVSVTTSATRARTR